MNFLLALAEPVGCIVERRKLQAALHKIVHVSSCASVMNHELDLLLNKLMRDIGFDYAAISVVDEYMEKIDMIRARNMAPRLMEMCRQDLLSNHIMADIVRTGCSELFSAGQYDVRFDKRIYEIFGYSDLARIFVPLTKIDGQGRSTVIGTIEAGCLKHRESILLTDQVLEKVEQLGKDHGVLIGQNRTHILLEIIAQYAIDIICADSASIHVP